MKCPMGYEHPATWHCYAIWVFDWILGRPERFDWPWLDRILMKLIVKIEDRTASPEESSTP